jgi:hypothetical protein
VLSGSRPFTSDIEELASAKRSLKIATSLRPSAADRRTEHRDVEASVAEQRR